MIVKIITPPRGARGRGPANALSTFPRDLTRYILRAESADLERVIFNDGVQSPASYVRELHAYVDGATHETVGATFFRNLISTDPDLIAVELEARLAGAQLSNRCVHHIVLSWREGEDYQRHIEEAAAIFLDIMGYANCPVVAGEHLDTQHPHLHLAIVPVDVTTGREVCRYEYDKVRSQMAAAVLCERFNWQPEENARHRVVDGLLVLDDQVVLGRADEPISWPDRRPDPRKGISKQAQKYEVERGSISLERLVRTRVPKLLEKCSDLEELAKELEQLGISLARFRNGAVFFDRNSRVKASLANRWSCTKIERKFGPLPRLDATDRGTLHEKPALTARGHRRIQYDEARKEFLLRLSATDYAFRHAPFADRRLAGRYCSDLATLTPFPTFEDWENGARPYDPVHVYAACFDFPAVTPVDADGLHARFSPLPYHYRKKLRAHPGDQERLQIAGEAICIDLQDRFVAFGRLSERQIEYMLQTLSDRGQRSLVTTCFTRDERKIADRYARQTGLVVVHAKDADEAEAMKREVDLKRTAVGNARKAIGDPFERQRIQSIPPPRSSTAAHTDEPSAPLGGVVSDPPSKSVPAALKPQSDKLAAQNDPQIHSAKLISDWQRAVVSGHADANRLAALVVANHEAILVAETALSQNELQHLKQAAAAHRLFMQNAAVSQGIGY